MTGTLFRRYAKFVVAAAGAVVAFVTAVLTDPSVATAVGDDNITGAEWRLIAISVISAALVYRVPNRAPVEGPADPDMSEQG